MLNKSKEICWNWELSPIPKPCIYGIIISSRAYNLCKSSKGLTLPTLSLVPLAGALPDVLHDHASVEASEANRHHDIFKDEAPT